MYLIEYQPPLYEVSTPKRGENNKFPGDCVMQIVRILIKPASPTILVTENKVASPTRFAERPWPWFYNREDISLASESKPRFVKRKPSIIGILLDTFFSKFDPRGIVIFWKEEISKKKPHNYDDGLVGDEDNADGEQMNANICLPNSSAITMMAT